MTDLAHEPDDATGDVTSDAPLEDDAPHEPTDPRSRVDWDRRDWAVVVALFVVSLVLVGLHTRAYPTLSPIDELAHVDYVIKAGDLDPPVSGDRIGFDAMAEAACRTLDVFQYEGPECGLDEYSPDQWGDRVFREGAVNTSANQFPGYYTSTGLLSRAMVATGLIESQVTGARLVGGLWAGAAWGVMWYVMAVLRLPRRSRALALVPLIATPLTLFHAATVNADAVLMLTGALTVLASIKFAQGRLKIWWLLAAYIGLSLMEPSNALAVGASAGFLLVRVSMDARRPIWDRAVPAFAVVLAVLQREEIGPRVRNLVAAQGPAHDPQLAAGSGGGGGPLRSLLAQAPPPPGVDWDRVIQQLGALFSPVNRAYLPPFMRTDVTAQLIELTDWLLIASLFATAAGFTTFIATRRRADRHAALAHGRTGEPAADGELSADAEEGATDDEATENLLWLVRFGTLALLLGGPFYTFSYAYFSNDDFDAPGRFGLPLVVILVVALAATQVNRFARAVTLAVGALAMINTVWLLVTP